MGEATATKDPAAGNHSPTATTGAPLRERAEHHSSAPEPGQSPGAGQPREPGQSPGAGQSAEEYAHRPGFVYLRGPAPLPEEARLDAIPAGPEQPTPQRRRCAPPPPPTAEQLSALLRIWVEVMEGRRRPEVLRQSAFSPALVSHIEGAKQNYRLVKRAVAGLASTQTLGAATTHTTLVGLDTATVRQREQIFRQLPAPRVCPVMITQHSPRKLLFSAQLRFGDKIRCMSGTMSVSTIERKTGLYQFMAEPEQYQRWCITRLALV